MFCETYPVANKVVKAIRVTHNKWHISKHSMPEEQDNSEEREDSHSESDT